MTSMIRKCRNGWKDEADGRAFHTAHKPEKTLSVGNQGVQKDYGLTPYMTIEKPDPYLMQNRYQGDNKEEMFFFSYAHRYNSHQTRISFSNEVVKGRQGWVWDLETGERYRLPLDAANSFLFDFGPADSLLIVFDKQKRGNDYKPLPVSGEDLKDLSSDWDVEFRHSRENTVQNTHFDKLKDLKDTDYVNFCGTIVYRKKSTSLRLSDGAQPRIGTWRVGSIRERAELWCQMVWPPYPSGCSPVETGRKQD